MASGVTFGIGSDLLVDPCAVELAAERMRGVGVHGVHAAEMAQLRRPVVELLSTQLPHPPHQARD